MSAISFGVAALNFATAMRLSRGPDMGSIVAMMFVFVVMFVELALCIGFAAIAHALRSYTGERYLIALLVTAVIGTLPIIAGGMWTGISFR